MKPSIQRPTPRNRAFTLVEMLVVIAIIAILVGFAMPAIGYLKKKAKIGMAKADIRSLVTAIHSYEAKYSRMPASAAVEESAKANPAAKDFTFGTVLPDGSLLHPAHPPIVSYGTPKYTTCNAELIAILIPDTSAATPVLAQLSAARNRDKLVFFDAKPAETIIGHGVGPDGIFRDPWGNPYIVTIDLEYGNNRRSTDGVYGLLRKNAKVRLSPEISGSVLVWSFGPDGKVNVDPQAGPDSGANEDNIVSWRE